MFTVQTRNFLAHLNVWLGTVKMCGSCKNENCFICKRFGFVFEELIYGKYLNLNEYWFKTEHS